MCTSQKTDRLATQLEKNIHPYFSSSELMHRKDNIVNHLTKHYDNYSKAEISRLTDIAFTQLTYTIRWSDFIRFICFILPPRWIKIASNPGIRASTMLLLTNGSVMCQDSGGKTWKRLAPDANGSYINGSWYGVAPMNTARLYYASAVLRDGRVFFSGGEYTDAGAVETNASEIYNPVTNTWTTISAPSGWNNVGDAACCVLNDGRLIMGNIFDNRTAIFNPVTNTWTAGPNKGTSSSEESWALQPDGSVLTVRCNSTQQAEKYIPATNTWVSAGTTPVNLIEIASSEIGAAVLMNNGKTFFIGATGRTAIYTQPATITDPGSWVAGPDFPAGPNSETIGCKDSPACLLTNGKVLISAGPVDGVRNDYLTPTYFYEFDGSSLHRTIDPPNNAGKPYQGRMLLLPNGQVMYAAETDEVYVYSYCSNVSACSRPVITNAPSYIRAGLSYTIHGQQINGLSQAVGYGDDAAAATNYPLVRIRNIKTGHVRYCRTFDHSSMGVATGSSIQSTTFVVPCDIEVGESEICVIANGISSVCQPVNVWNFRIIWEIDELLVNRLIGSLADGPLWVLGPNGPIPVDPWGPKYRKLAQQSWNEIFKNVHILQQLGNELNKDIQHEVSGQPIAIDTGDEDEEGEKQESEEEHEAEMM